MAKLRRLKQNGSTTVFFIVGIILTIGLIGAVFALRQRGDQIRKEQAIATYDKQQAAEESSKTSETSDKTTENNDTDVNVATSSEESAVTSVASNELPTTGAAFSVGELLETGVLSIVVVGYVLSRRNLARSL